MTPQRFGRDDLIWAHGDLHLSPQQEPSPGENDRLTPGSSALSKIPRVHHAENVSDAGTSFLQQRGPVDDERDGCCRVVGRERVDEEALAVGRDVVGRAWVYCRRRTRVEQ
jgi:hypothetical protein